MRGKKILSSVCLIVLAASLFYASLQTKSDTDCIGWPMFGRMPDGCHWVPPECSPKSSEYELKWVYNTNEEQLLRKVLLVGNRIIAYGYSGKLYSLVANSSNPDGNFVWTYNLASPIKTPCTDGKRMYIGLESGKLECVDMSSKILLWSIVLEDSIVNHPMVYQGKLYIHCQKKASWQINSLKEYLYCLNAKTGKVIWVKDDYEPVFGAPAFYGNKMVIATDIGSIYCYDLNITDPAKNVLWTKQYGARVYSPAIRNGKVYGFATIKADAFEYFCLNLDDGSPIWSYPVKKRAEYYDFTTVNDKYFICDYVNGLNCIDAATGKLVWSKENVGFSATMTDDYIFTVNNSSVMCLDIRNGSILWSHPVDGPTGPAIADRDMLFLRGGKKVYAFKLKNPTYPELEDDPESNSDDGVVQPSRIAIKPKTVAIEPGQEQQFSAFIYDDLDKLMDVDSISWEVTGDSGIVDENGLFTATKEGNCKLKCTCSGLSDEAVVHVVKFLKAEPSAVVLDNVPISSTIPFSIKLKCSDYKPVLATIENKNNDIVVKPTSMQFKSGETKDLACQLDTQNMMPGNQYERELIIKYDGGVLTIPVKISTSVDRIDCLDVTPKRLDFEYVSRGGKKTLNLKVFSSRKAMYSLKPSSAWIELSTDRIELDAQESFDLTVTIQPSAMPSGQSFTGSIEITDDQGICKFVAVPVFIETDERISLVLTVDSDQAYLNKKPVKMDAPARIINGRTMVPIRFISESFGCKVEWDPKEGKVTIIRNDITIRLWKGRNYAKVNEEEKTLDSPPIIIKGRTYVPLRFISEPFGAKVNWDKTIKKITIIWDPL
jgi:outer membrane protein assembly factor BamB